MDQKAPASPGLRVSVVLPRIRNSQFAIRNLQSPLIRACLLAAACLPSASTFAQGLRSDPSFQTLSLSVETIREDVVWSGEKLITKDVAISGATVRVLPGSTIRFVGIIGQPGTILLESPPPDADQLRRPSCLLLEGTPDRPIIVETPQGRPPGAIIARPAASSVLVARHVVFRGLGEAAEKKETQPALLLSLRGADDDLWLEDCRFEKCGPVRAEFTGPDATAHVEQCTFSDTAGRDALVLAGSGTGIKVAADNVADAGFRFECPQTLVSGNVLIGDHAAITVPDADAPAVTLRDNYIHSTATDDVGRYALQCRPADALVTGNVLIGGTYVIAGAPRRVEHNVLIGVGGLQATIALTDKATGQIVSSTRITPTHNLITDLGPDARVTDNYFLGPCYAAVATSDRTSRPTLEHNFFDGFDLADRAVSFNVLANQAVGATFSRNVVARYRKAPLHDEAGRSDTLAGSGDNLFVAVPDPPYDKLPSHPRLAPNDRILESFAALLLSGSPASRPAPDLETELRQRRATIADARRTWLDAYSPRAESPLLAAAGLGPRLPAR